MKVLVLLAQGPRRKRKRDPDLVAIGRGRGPVLPHLLRALGPRRLLARARDPGPRDQDPKDLAPSDHDPRDLALTGEGEVREQSHELPAVLSRADGVELL